MWDRTVSVEGVRPVDNYCWKLQALLDGFISVPEPLQALEVSALVTDSRKVVPGVLFIALNGTEQDGADYTAEAFERGAIAALQEGEGDALDQRTMLLANLRQRLGEIASRFYAEPSRVLKVVAVTGTDGKSSVSHFIAAALERLEGGAAVLGTLGNRICSGTPLSAAGSHTTPPPVALQGLLADVVAAGGRSVALEASSHGIEQGRLAGVALDCAVLTQLGRDHLDYHGSVEAYAAAKRALFDHPGLRSRVINQDDSLGAAMIEAYSGVADQQLLSYSLNDPTADLYGKLLRQERDGLKIEIHYRGESLRCSVPLYGAFNGSNLLATLGVLLCLETPFTEAVKVLEQLKALDGRMEPFQSNGRSGATLVVDYAHTPGALESALQATRAHLQEAGGQLWVVFGCGGDRDTGKRPEMGAVAERLADHTILTSDNPRSESPMAIIEQIAAGMERPGAATLIEERERAIRTAWERAAAEDVILIAGKGHETTQTVAGETLPWSDRQLAAELTAMEVGR